MKPQVCILRTDGTNCDKETAFAFQKVGGEPSLVHVNELRSGKQSLHEFQILAIPGGFSYGDDIAAGKVLAVELTSYLRDELQSFVDRGGLVIGICNGFQVLVRTGLLPFGNLGVMQATLTLNDSGRFECRWVSMIAESSSCVFTQGIEGTMELPVAHGEGKFYAPDQLYFDIGRKHVALFYVEEGEPTMSYPANPNGSSFSIAGVCDSTGHIFGLMPHPERYVERTQHPNWRRNINHTEPHGLQIFRNAVNYVV